MAACGAVAGQAATTRPSTLLGVGLEQPFVGAVEAVVGEALSRLHFEVAVAARSAVFLHAAAVVVEDRLFLFPGRSGHGKSTVAAALVAAGGTYFSDEDAPVDAEGRVWSYRKPASLRPESAALLSPVAAGSGAEPAPRSCDFVLGARFATGAQWRPRRLSAGEAALLTTYRREGERLRVVDKMYGVQFVAQRDDLVPSSAGGECSEPRFRK
jgi:hypothetical protein